MTNCEGCRYKSGCFISSNYPDQIKNCPCRTCLVKVTCSLTTCQIYINWVGTKVDERYKTNVKEHSV
jgi:hypothetical protein